MKIIEIENDEGPFVKYTILENNHLYGTKSMGILPSQHFAM